MTVRKLNSKEKAETKLADMCAAMSTEARTIISNAIKKHGNPIKEMMIELAQWEAEAKALFQNVGFDKPVDEIESYIRSNPPSAGAIALLIKIAQDELNSKRARHAAEVGHNQKNGSRDKQKRIRELWASGNYQTKEQCAKNECGKIGMSFETARRALRTPRTPP
jgi:hypothetical protein